MNTENKIVIGIDVGISTTKIVGLRDGKVISPFRITAADPITSLYGAFGKYLHDNEISLDQVEHVMLTGVGANYVQGDVYGVKTSRCDEFVADALGARYESHIDHAIVVSMGTGTSFVMCNGSKIDHIGDIGIGGGDPTAVNCHIDHSLKIRQGDNGQLSTFQPLARLIELIIKDDHYTQNDATRFAHGVEALETIIARRELILDQHHLLPRLDVALNEVLEAMVFGRGAHIYHGQR